MSEDSVEKAVKEYFIPQELEQAKVSIFQEVSQFVNKSFRQSICLCMNEDSRASRQSRSTLHRRSYSKPKSASFRQ